MLNFLIGFFLVFPLYIVFPDLELFIEYNITREVTFLEPFQKALPVTIFSLSLLVIKYCLRCPADAFRILLFFPLSVWILIDLGYIFSIMLSGVLLIAIGSRSFFSVFTKRESYLIFFGSLVSISIVCFGIFYDFIFLHNSDWRILYGVNTSFGYEIYAFYVSFAAVLSLYIMAIFSIVFDIPFKNIFLTIILFFLVFALMATSRRAPYIELLLYLIAVFIFSFNIKSNSIRIKDLSVSFLASAIVIFYYNWLQEQRTFTAAELIDSRGESNEIFFRNLSYLNPVELLYGFEGGTFGGYSNLFFDLFVRVGLVGCLYYLVLLIFGLTNLIKFWGMSSYTKKAVLCLIISAAVGNVANLSFSQPYYVTSLLAVCFLINYLGAFNRNDSRL